MARNVKLSSEEHMRRNWRASLEWLVSYVGVDTMIVEGIGVCLSV